jgi:hypothetical protein
VRRNPKSKSEFCVAGVGVPSLKTSEDWSAVEMDSGWSDEVFGLCCSIEGCLVGSIAEATGLRSTGVSLICDGRAVSSAVFGRGRSVETAAGFVRPELAGEKKEVSTFSLDFLRCGFAPVPSSCTAPTGSDALAGCPNEPAESFSSLATRFVTDLEGMDRTEVLLPLDERETLLDGMVGEAESTARCSHGAGARDEHSSAAKRR